jgi:hypothetical protein
VIPSGSWHTVTDRDDWRGRRDTGRQFLKAARNNFLLGDRGDSGAPVIHDAILAGIAYADALTIKVAGIKHGQNHQTLPATVRHALGNRLPEAERTRLGTRGRWRMRSPRRGSLYAAVSHPSMLRQCRPRLLRASLTSASGCHGPGASQCPWNRRPNCDPRNAPSVAVPRRLGYRLEGTVGGDVVDAGGRPRDTMIWALSDTECAPSPAARVPIDVRDEHGLLWSQGVP